MAWRCEPFEIAMRDGKTVQVAERQCRCGSCETVKIRIFDTDDRSDCIEYNTKSEGSWYPPGCDEGFENKAVIARAIFELAKLARKP